ncbi:MAG: adenylate/guanylate cyclase domain-containing protein [Chromatiales bacterium]
MFRSLHLGYAAAALLLVFVLDVIRFAAGGIPTPFAGAGALALPLLVLEMLRRPLTFPAAAGPTSEATSRRHVLFESGTFFLAGLALAALEVVLLGQPPARAAQLFLAVLTVGLFAAHEAALASNGWWLEHGSPRAPDLDHITPLRSKLVSAASSLGLAVVMLFALTLNTLLVHPPPKLTAEPHLLVAELVVVGIAALLLTLRLINAASSNMEVLLGRYVDVLRRVRKGEFDKALPVLTDDELGLVAQQTNQVIDGLRSEARLRRTLERVVSPAILDKLLSTDDKTLKQGQKYEVAILFCDLREFTRFSENASAEEVILFLNDYFSELVELVSANAGIVNKFMGDAVLAIYGLDATPRPVEDAVATAWAILENANDRLEPGGAPLDIGIGIHSGNVVAGTIGSEERYEYTFIGDPVNTASRLDGLSKRLGHRIIISDDAYRTLRGETQARFTDLGRHRVRGKRDPVHVWGAGALVAPAPTDAGS